MTAIHILNPCKLDIVVDADYKNEVTKLAATQGEIAMDIGYGKLVCISL